MSPQPYLIFQSNHSRYGIAALAVQEVFFLPALKAIAEAPADVVGVLNLRGEILPVMDFNRRLGYAPQPYHLSDSVIVIKYQDFHLGMIVNQINEVQMLDITEANLDLTYGRKTAPLTQRFIQQVLNVGNDIITVLDTEQLVRYSDQTVISEAYQVDPMQGFAPDATAQEQLIFQQRAENLITQSTTEDATDLLPLAVVGLQGEYFSLGLEVVHEFTDVQKITPIPCCPPHIVGNINLRGEILTLVDISQVLNLPTNQIGIRPKAIVVHLDHVVVGITVDEVLDVVYVHPTTIKPVPAAVSATHDEYLQGIVPFQENIMSILDLSKILSKGNLIVDEEA
ncbi:chemotaxis protein CheW [Pantanalinema rosaneae CENA516]|uniref:chemotaxis protein CheW n=1 Tax=Pantanalinema rosaneae TaxID=1620701 RepID=UPI003D6FA133